MGKIRLTGATSGYTELKAAEAAGNNTITLPTTNGGEVIVSDSSGNVNIDSGTLYVDASNNRVGVGTSSAQAPLHVLGAATVSSVSDVTAKLGRTGDSAVLIGSTDGNKPFIASEGAYPLYLRTNNQNALVVDSSQRVGIGTTSPSTKLHIHDGSGSSAQIVKIDSGGVGLLSIQSGTTTDSRIEFGDSANDDAGYIYYENDNDVMMFGVNGSERARIDSSGRLLVGTNTSADIVSIQSRVQIQGTTLDDASIRVQRTNGSPGIFLSAGASGNNVANGDFMGVIDFYGYHTTYARGARISAEVDGTPGSGDLPTRLVFSTTADGASSPTERMRIGSDGVVLIGKTSDVISNPGWAIRQNGTSQLATNVTGGPILRLNHTGAASTEYLVETWKNGAQVGSISVTSSATAYNTSSDYRLKENVTPVTDGITRLQQLKPSRFNFIADPGTVVDGFIAHEVQAVVPEAITGEKDAVDENGDPVYQGIDQSKLVPLLTAALQEAIGRIETLEAEVAALKAQ